MTKSECDQHCVGRDNPKCKDCWVDEDIEMICPNCFNTYLVYYDNQRDNCEDCGSKLVKKR